MNENYLKEKEYFDKNLNISYVDETLSVPDNKLILKHYISSLIIYGIIILFLQFNPYFHKFSSPITRAILDLYYVAYIFIAPLIYFIFRPKSLYRSHNIEIMNYFKRVFFHIPKLKNFTPDEIKKELEYYKPNYYEGQSLMLLFIKSFFGIQMLFYAYSIASNINYELLKLKEFYYEGNFFLYKEALYRFIVDFLFFTDVFIFTIGYLTELAILNNKIRTVETSFAGVFFCLICYQPFSCATSSFIGNSHQNILMFMDNVSPWLIWLIRGVAIFFLIIYVLASAALFTKGSNLTNRGIVSRFPYNIVRHPAYISKNILWFILVLPPILFTLNTGDIKANLINLVLVCLSLSFWASIYYFRALTEERHLIKDPDYREYIKKVKYRFIPKII